MADDQIQFSLLSDIVPPPCLTRQTHTVRIKSANGKFFADIEILDAFSVMLPNNTQLVFTLKAVNPNIIDNTGDGNGKTPGDSGPGNVPSRISHMQRVTSLSDPSSYIDIEVCDGFSVTGPNDAEFALKCPGLGQVPPNYSAPGALPKFLLDSSGNPTVPYMALVKPAIIDNTGAGLTVAATKQSTKAEHIMALARQVTNGNYEGGAGTIASTDDFLLIALTDATTFNGPPQTKGMPWQVQPLTGNEGDVRQFVDQNTAIWYAQHVMFTPNVEQTINGVLYPAINTVDTTQYVTDPLTKEIVPPPPDPSVDLNNFIFFPPDMTSPFLGAGVAVDMGPLWWIRQIGTTPNVWFWFLNPVQQPKAFSFFGIPPEAGPIYWAYRGFTYLPDFPVSWIQSVNYPLVNMGVYGADTLNDAATGYGTSMPGPNWFGYGITPMNTTFAVSTTQTQSGDVDALDDSLPQLTYTPGTYYPYGALDFTAPRSTDLLAYTRRQGQNTSIYTDYGGPTPNIWEITGLPSPPLKVPFMADGHTPNPWDPNNNPYLQPSVSAAAACAKLFASNWNAVANALNDACAAANGNVHEVPGFPFTPPPGWNWATPYGGDSVPTAQMFNNAWVPSVLAVETVPCYIPTIAVDQLDPTVWDIQMSLDTGNPPLTWAYEIANNIPTT